MNKYILLLIPFLLVAVDHSIVVDDGMNYARGLLSTQKANFDANVIQPLTTGSQMKSVDGSQGFTAQMGCTNVVNSQKFITVNYDGSDNITIYINMDFDLDGTSEINTRLANISGVCANGVVQCNGGWDEAHCKYYQWQLAPNTDYVVPIEVTPDLVNSCYCTNNACTNSALSQKEEILNVLVTSISQTVANTRPKYVLTRVENTGTLATGYAQSTDGCTQASMGSQVGVSSEQLTINANTEINYQANQNGDTAYSFMQQQQANISNNPVRNEALTYSVNHANFDSTVSQNLDLDQDNMRVNSYGDGTFTDSAELSDLGIHQPIIKYCKVKVWEEVSTVFSDSTISTETNDDDKKYHIQIRECDGNTCLYDNSKEELKENCAEGTNNFKEAVSQLAAINEASKDMVCSSN